MTPLRMVVFAFVVMVYVPCISTMTALVKEDGWKVTAGISAAEVGLARLLRGILAGVLALVLCKCERSLMALDCASFHIYCSIVQ